MPKFFRLLGSQKRRSSFSPSSPTGKKKKNGIFRSTTKRSTKKTTTAPPVIEAAITYSLSEDEMSCDITLFSNTDIENQFSTEELKRENVTDNIAFTKATGPIATKEIDDIEIVDSVDSQTNDSFKIVKENDKTMTFTHLEIMRNELGHMRQIADKEKEIYQVKQEAEKMKIQHAEIVALKDVEIARIKNVVTEVESALSLVENQWAIEESEHSKTIELLMKTQYEYHELNAKSWFQPLCCYF